MRRGPLAPCLALLGLLVLRGGLAQDDTIEAFDVVINEQKCPVANYGPQSFRSATLQFDALRVISVTALAGPSLLRI